MQVNLEADDDLAREVAAFQVALPYRDDPYNSRMWGHRLHSLCSYQGKLKPALAHWLVRQFTAPGELVVDPLSGVGTIPFEAALLGRRSIANDLSPFAATVARAKVDPPPPAEAREALTRLGNAMAAATITDADVEAASFGLNATVRDYYHPDTLDEVLRARRVYLDGQLTDRGAAFVWASLLHVLHGNRPYALSRTSHPITPFNPTGPFEYKSVIEKTLARMERALLTPLPDAFVAGRGIEGDFRNLTSVVDDTEEAAAVITSPPFLGMRFDRPNWLRMWFCGWTADDFHKKSLHFLERQQTKSLSCYEDFYEVCAKLLRPNGLLIIHIGSGKKDRLVDGLRDLAKPRFRLIAETVEDVAALEQHGLSDKGNRTTSHHLLFFRRS
jgi:SAM-dependent methyltransferase